MAVTLNGKYNLPLATLKTMLSESTSFQAWTGTVTAAAALAFIGILKSEQLVDTFPRALIGREGLDSVMDAAGGSAIEFGPAAGMGLLVALLDTPDTGEASDDRDLNFLVETDAIMEELEGDSGQAGNLWIKGLRNLEFFGEQYKESGKVHSYRAIWRLDM